MNRELAIQIISRMIENDGLLFSKREALKAAMREMENVQGNELRLSEVRDRFYNT